MELVGLARSLLGLFGSLWVSLDLFGSLWVFLDRFGYLCVSLGLFGSLWLAYSQYLHQSTDFCCFDFVL